MRSEVLCHAGAPWRALLLLSCRSGPPGRRLWELTSLGWWCQLRPFRGQPLLPQATSPAGAWWL
eukprot:999122-Amphidinium_carterae.1